MVTLTISLPGNNRVCDTVEIPSGLANIIENLTKEAVLGADMAQVVRYLITRGIDDMVRAGSVLASSSLPVG